MDPAPEEQLDYGDDEYGGAQKMQYQGGGTIPALADEELMGEEDDYEDLYEGVNVGEAFQQFHRPQAPNLYNNAGNGGVQAQTSSVPEPRRETDASRNNGITTNTGSSFPEQKGGAGAAGVPEMGSANNTGPLMTQMGSHKVASGNIGFQASSSSTQRAGINVPNTNNSNSFPGPTAAQEMANHQIPANANMNTNHTVANDTIIRPQMDNGPTMLFVGELHWWTTDSDLESVLSQFGKVKEIKFFDERASGKSKGYCQVEFYDSAAAAACKEGMDGHLFNGRACVVAFASPQTLKQMGAAFANKNQSQLQAQPQGGRNVNDGAGRGGGANFSAGDGGRNYGRGGWGRGGQGVASRGPVGGGPRGRGGPMGPRNFLGNAAGVGGGAVGNFGQGLAGPGFGGPGGGMVPPQGMMGPGFDPSFMGRGAGYGGFSGPAFPGMMPQFPAVNPMGLAGVAPHVNPAFFGRGMAPNGMGMMGTSGMDGNPGGMWAGPGMGGWGGEEHGQRTRESSYGGDDGASDYGYGEANPEKGARASAAPQREKERAPDRDRTGNSDRRYREEREQDWDRSDRDHRYREDKDDYREHRRKERDLSYEDDWDRGHSSSRSRSRSRAVPGDDYRSRSRDVDYGKRRRAPSE